MFILPILIDEIHTLGVERYWNNSCDESDLELEQPIWPQGAITQIFPMYISNMMHCDMSDRKHDRLVNKLIQQIKVNEIREVIVYGAGDFFLNCILSYQKLGSIYKMWLTRKQKMVTSRWPITM